MLKEEIVKYFKFKKFQNKNFYHFIIIPILMILVYILVYITDDKVYAHAMYIPIIYASFVLDVKYSTLFGIIGGIILGPLIPFSIETGESQEMIQWIFRLIMFTSIGFFSGLLINMIRNNSIKIIDLFSLDQSTKLPNQYGLQLYHANMDLSKPKTIISIIINNYEVLLDILGSDLYSKLIIKISKILKLEFDNPIIVKPTDKKLWIIIEQLDSELIVSRIKKTLHNNLVIEDVVFYLEYSIGLSYPNDENDYVFDKAYLNADMAAREAIKNQLLYTKYNYIKQSPKNEFNIIGEFSNVFTNNELYLDYQPIIDLKNNKISKLEALIRWHHPKRGLISPDEFIPLIEQTQLIHKLTNWVILEVIKKIEEFKNSGIDILFSINISAKNLYDPNFVDSIIDIKKKFNVAVNQIELEITESIELIDNNKSQFLLAKLKDNGFSIAIDDFGKGYSSLSTLHQFPATTLKIDKYFSKQMESNPNIINVVEGVINFAHKLGLKTVFEGVETKSIDSDIKDINSDYGQGYFYSRPIKCQDIIPFYKKNNGYIII